VDSGCALAAGGIAWGALLSGSAPQTFADGDDHRPRCCRPATRDL